MYVWENVDTFDNEDNATGSETDSNLAVFLRAAEQMGYLVLALRACASEAGVAQRRRRLFVIGVKKEWCAHSMQDDSAWQGFCKRFQTNFAGMKLRAPGLDEMMLPDESPYVQSELQRRISLSGHGHESGNKSPQWPEKHARYCLAMGKRECTIEAPLEVMAHE